MITYRRIIRNFVNLKLFFGVRAEPIGEAVIAVAVLTLNPNWVIPGRRKAASPE